MKPHDKPSKDLRHIEVPRESMDAMARQIRSLERVSTLRRGMVRWSAVAAVAAVAVTVGWFSISVVDRTGNSEGNPVLIAVRHPSTPVQERLPEQSVEEMVTPEHTDGVTRRRCKPSRRPSPRPVEKNCPAAAAVEQEDTGQESIPEDTGNYEDCPVMVYESGKLVACGSMESIPEVDEIFHELACTMGGSQQVLSSGAETFNNVMKTINSSGQQ